MSGPPLDPEFFFFFLCATLARFQCYVAFKQEATSQKPSIEIHESCNWLNCGYVQKVRIQSLTTSIDSVHCLQLKSLKGP
jgi:hypothetical protein